MVPLDDRDAMAEDLIGERGRCFVQQDQVDTPAARSRSATRVPMSFGWSSTAGINPTPTSRALDACPEPRAVDPNTSA